MSAISFSNGVKNGEGLARCPGEDTYSLLSCRVAANALDTLSYTVNIQYMPRCAQIYLDIYPCAVCEPQV